MLVWTDKTTLAGRIAHEQGDYIFSYDRNLPDAAAVSLTMPIETRSYDWRGELHPVFQMNLPEGALRHSIDAMFSKAIPNYNELDVLRITGQSQIGRLRYTDEGSTPDRIPTQSVSDILHYSGTEDLMTELLQKFARQSGVSGVQPKILIKDSDLSRLTVQGTTHIIKTFDATAYPELAANEYFCMRACARAGLSVPPVELSDNGRFLVIDRFDIAEDHSYLGLEDFCSLSGLGTKRKYDSSYEMLAKRIRDFVSPEHRRHALQTYFKSLAMTCAIRNGDAHLKNFAVLYRDADAPVTLAPTFDMVSTCVYIRNDSMALLLDGSKRFAHAKKLCKFARTHCGMSEQEAQHTLEQVGQALSETAIEVKRYAADHPRFNATATAMLQQWQTGLAQSIQGTPSAN